MNKNTCILFIVFFFISCANNSNFSSGKSESFDTKKHKKEKKQESSDQTEISSSSDCDPLKWKFVYNPSRLEVLDKCKVVTGVITERDSNEDGDEHMLLKLDPGQDDLLKKKNFSKKDGCLVIEAVCVNNITRKKVKGVCEGYVNNVLLPVVGDHVKVTGSYVLDSHNGWTEIHPISEVEKLK